MLVFRVDLIFDPDLELLDLGLEKFVYVECELLFTDGGRVAAGYHVKDLFVAVLKTGVGGPRYLGPFQEVFEELDD